MKKLLLLLIMISLAACGGTAQSGNGGGNGNGNGNGSGGGNGNGDGGGGNGNGSGGEQQATAGETALHVDGAFVTGFTADSLADVNQHTFQDSEQGGNQNGWLLSDVLATLLDKPLADGTIVVVSSSARGSSIELTAAEINDAANNVILAITNRGTFRLASTLEQLDERSEWVADVDKIEVNNP